MRSLLLSAFLGVLLARAALPAADPKKPATDLNELSLEVEALQLIYQFELTSRQLQALAKIAADLPPPARERKPAKANEKLRALLTDLRTALRKHDDNRIDELTGRVDDLKDSAALDDRIEVTAEVRKRVPELLRLLTTRQVNDYLNVYDDLPDPVASVRDALKSGLKAAQIKDWSSLRDEAAEEVGWLVAGFDTEKAKKVAEQTAALLDKAHAWKEDELKQRRAELETAVQEIMGDVDAVDVMRHVVERDLAELLANPQLAAAVEGRLKEMK